MKRMLLQPLALAIVLGIIGLFSVWTRQPWLVPSLGSASFVQILEPRQPSARPYGTSIGQLLGVLGGFIGVWVAFAAPTPIFMADHPLVYTRVLAVVIGVLVTSALQLVTKAKSAAGGTICLLLTLGIEAPSWSSVWQIVIGVLLVTVLGETCRRLVLAAPE